MGQNLEVVSSQESTSEGSAKRGRPFTTSTGEARSQKITIYVTPSMEADIKDLATICGRKVSDIALSLLEPQIQAKAHEIEQLRKIREGMTL